MFVSHFTFSNGLGALLQWLDCILAKRTKKEKKHNMIVTWYRLDLTEHRKINVCTSATLPPDWRWKWHCDGRVSYSSRKQTTTSNVGITSTDSAGNSQVKHTDMYYTGSFSRYTLYTSLENTKKKLVVCFFCGNSPISLRASTLKQSTADTRLQVASFSSLRGKTHFLWFGQWQCRTFSHVLMHLLLFVLFSGKMTLKSGTACWSTVQRKERRGESVHCSCATSRGNIPRWNCVLPGERFENGSKRSPWIWQSASFQLWQKQEVALLLLLPMKNEETLEVTSLTLTMLAGVPQRHSFWPEQGDFFRITGTEGFSPRTTCFTCSPQGGDTLHPRTNTSLSALSKISQLNCVG